MAFGSSANYGTCLVFIETMNYITPFAGPGCGRCFKLTLQNPVVATPPFHPDVVKSVVVKIIDLCPLSSVGWCSGTSKKPNSYAALCISRELSNYSFQLLNIVFTTYTVLGPT